MSQGNLQMARDLRKSSNIKVKDLNKQRKGMQRKGTTTVTINILREITDYNHGFYEANKNRML